MAMSAVAIPSECECGCGTPINVAVLAVVHERQHGCTVREAALRAGVSYASAKMAGRQFSRFVRGHQTARAWETRTCRTCGGEFKTPETSGRWRCRNCPMLDPVAWIRANCEEYDERQERHNERMRERRHALFGGRPPTRLGTPKRIIEQRAAWERLLVETFGGKVEVPPLLTREQEALVTDNLRLVPWALKRFHPPPGMDDDDLQAVGMIGLMRAAERFDPSRGFKFSTLATSCIQNEVRHLIAGLTALKRGGSGQNGEKRIAAPPASLDALREDVGYDVPAEEDTAEQAESELVNDVLTRASAVDRRLPEILRRRMEGDTLSEIADDLSISQQRVSQLIVEARALVDPAMVAA